MVRLNHEEVAVEFVFGDMNSWGDLPGLMPPSASSVVIQYTWVDQFHIYNDLSGAVVDYLRREASSKEWWSEISGVEMEELREEDGDARMRLLIHVAPRQSQDRGAM